MSSIGACSNFGLLLGFSSRFKSKALNSNDTFTVGLSIACLPSEASDGLSSLSSQVICEVHGSLFIILNSSILLQILEISDAATPYFCMLDFLASSLAFTIGTVSRIFFSSSFNLRFMNHSTLH